MVKGIRKRDALIVGVVVAIIVLGIIGYFIFFRGDEGGNDENGDEDLNHAPEADAGYDISIGSGEEFFLSGERSTDKDGDDLFFFWDLDAGVDSNSDGIRDNDKDIVGENISYIYPLAFETITYIVTLNVTDGPYNSPDTLWDTDIVKVTIVVNETESAPEVSLDCQYQDALPPLEAHFVVVVRDISSQEFIANFSFRVENANGDTLEEGSVSDIILVPRNATVRFVDTPALTSMDPNDNFNIKEEGEIVEGSWFCLFYLNYREPVGEVELTT
ncbi:MAG: PKD domain-containing protein [Thermoplasmatota archaeon]